MNPLLNRTRPFAAALLTLAIAAASCRSTPSEPHTTPAPAANQSPPPAAAGQRPDDPAAASMDRYYLSTCAACESVLGSKSEAVALLHRGRELRFCCDMCADAFRADPESVLAKLDRRMSADQSPYYPLKTCLVSGAPLGEIALDVIWGNRLFRVAGPAQRERLLADPKPFLAALNKAVVEAQRPAYGMPAKCPVQGDILEGDPVIDIVVANRMVRVCCGRCARAVRASPNQYLSMVEYANRAEAARRAAEGAAR